MDSPGELDALTNFSIKNKLGGKMSSVFTPLRPYEEFAANVGQRLGEDTDIKSVENVSKVGLHYLLKFTVEYQGKDSP